MNVEDLLCGATALVVGTNADGPSSIGSILSGRGMTVLAATSGFEGLEIAERQPDIVIVDAHSTDMSAVEFTASLKLNPLTQSIPITLWSTTEVTDDERVRGLEAGADLYLAEPVAHDLVAALIAAQLRQRELSRQLELAMSLEESGVYDWSIPTGQVRWTDSLAHIHGMEPADFGGTFDDFVATVHPVDRERVGSTLDAALAGGDRLDMSYRFVRADGTRGWMESRGRVFRSIDGDAVRLLGLANDVTARVVERQRVEQLRRLASELTAARTSQRVIDVLTDELRGTSLGVRLSSADPPAEGDVVFSYETSSGRLELLERPGGGEGDDVTIRQATAIGELAGTALDRALRFEAERSNGVALQRALLPAATPEIDGWWIDSEYVPASEDDRLGGDFFDVIELEESFVIVIGDVAGHGLGATTQMGTVRTLMRALAASHDGDPLAILQRARSLFERVCGDSSPFVSTCVARCDRNGVVVLASAGHPPPLIRRDGSVAVADLTAGPPLGTFAEAEDTIVEVALEADDWVAFYTDGVIERRDRALAETIGEVASDLAQVITAQDFIRIGERATGVINHDDRAVVIVRRRPAG